jgi:hypothetical protein
MVEEVMVVAPLGKSRPIPEGDDEMLAPVIASVKLDAVLETAIWPAKDVSESVPMVLLVITADRRSVDNASK